MADFADVASEIEADRLALSLQNRQCYDTESEYECQECGNEIPERRRALGGVKLCIDCQIAVESDLKHNFKTVGYL